jgi:hypothetical protein
VKTPAPERAAGRKALAAKGQALPGGEEPIPDLAYLKKAIRSVGRLDPAKRPALKALIVKRARELGATNAKGVKGTWAFQGANSTEGAITLAMPAKLPTVRGAADISVTRSGPGTLNVTHRSTGMKVGAMTASPDGKTGWTATHASGKKMDAAPSVSGALAGLIAYHNKLAAGKLPAGKTVAATAEPQKAVSLSGAFYQALTAKAVDLAVTVASASDGPRVTSMGAGKPAAAKPATALNAKLGLSPMAAKVFARLRKRGMAPKAALAFAKRADSMRGKKPAAKAA